MTNALANEDYSERSNRWRRRGGKLFCLNKIIFFKDVDVGNVDGIFLHKASSDGANGSQGKPDYRQMCKYGTDCYQKNPMHHQKFKHPSTELKKSDTETPDEENDDTKPDDLKQEEGKAEVCSFI